jgi:hypothetical protein
MPFTLYLEMSLPLWIKLCLILIIMRRIIKDEIDILMFTRRIYTRLDSKRNLHIMKEINRPTRLIIEFIENYIGNGKRVFSDAPLKNTTPATPLPTKRTIFRVTLETLP